ncbi:hypothetical protein C8R46DRAFT_1028559 [Mycena filopes]|nr:hypothetical protein C8R46DRAFT_1028559 [Mycena filopes]
MCSMPESVNANIWMPGPVSWLIIGAFTSNPDFLLTNASLWTMPIINMPNTGKSVIDASGSEGDDFEYFQDVPLIPNSELQKVEPSSPRPRLRNEGRVSNIHPVVGPPSEVAVHYICDPRRGERNWRFNGFGQTRPARQLMELGGRRRVSWFHLRGHIAFQTSTAPSFDSGPRYAISTRVFFSAWNSPRRWNIVIMHNPPCDTPRA